MIEANGTLFQREHVTIATHVLYDYFLFYAAWELVKNKNERHLV